MFSGVKIGSALPGRLRHTLQTPWWLGLTVKNAALQTPTEGTVEFVARGRTREGAFRMHEISRFEKRDGVWIYVDGTFPDKS